MLLNLKLGKSAKLLKLKYIEINANIFNRIHTVMSEMNDSKEDFIWPRLTIDLVGTSFKVIGDLTKNSKLKIVDNTHLAKDDTYFQSLLRVQGREEVISFLNHLFLETERLVWGTLKDIRDGTDIDTNVSILQGLIGKIYVFLHRYENMRDVYEGDSSAKARLGIIRDKFFTFLNTFYRDVLIVK